MLWIYVLPKSELLTLTLYPLPRNWDSSLTTRCALYLFVISLQSNDRHIYSWSLENVPCHCPLSLRSPSSPLLLHRQYDSSCHPTQRAQICGPSYTWILLRTYSGVTESIYLLLYPSKLFGPFTHFGVSPRHEYSFCHIRGQQRTSLQKVKWPCHWNTLCLFVVNYHS